VRAMFIGNYLKYPADVILKISRKDFLI